MTTLKSISARNLKGQTFQHQLAPVTMFTGPNFTGKTSRIDAVYLALLGWLPGISKKPNEIYADLASGSAMGVTAILSDGVEIGRNWEEQRGSVKATSVGDFIDMPPVALVTSEFLSLSPAERVKFLFARAKLPPEYTPEAIRKTVCANVKNIKLDENTVESEQAITDLVTFVLGRQSTATAQEYLANLAVDVNEKKKLAAQSVQRMEKTGQGMAVIAPSEQAQNSAESEWKAAQENLMKWREELAKTEAEVRRLTQLLADTKKLAESGLPDEAAARAELKRLEAEKAKVAKLCEVMPEDKSLDAEQKVAEEEFFKLTNEESASFRALEKANQDLAALKSDDMPVCKACGQSIKKKIETLLPLAEKALFEAREQYNGDKKVADAIREVRDAIQLRRTKLNEKIAAFNANQQQFRALSAAHLAIIKKLENNAAASQAKASIAGLEQQLALTGQLKLDGVEQVSLAQAKFATTEAAYKDLVAQRARCQQQELARQELAKSRVEAEVLKAAVKLLQELQEKLVDAAVAPLIAKANELCGGLLLLPLAYKDGDIGFAENGRFYSHRSFSGTEKALAYAAISVALAQDAPIKLVILDELGRLDAKNKGLLLAKLCELTGRGVIDQALLVDVETPGQFEDPQFKLIQL